MHWSILEMLNAKPSIKRTSEQFLGGVECYEMNVDGAEVFFSEVSFRTGEDLRDKDVVEFYIRKGEFRSHVTISKEMVRTYKRNKEDNFVVHEIRQILNENLTQ